MTLCYVATQGALVSCGRGRLVVKLGGRIIQWTHLKDLERIVICGNVTMSPAAIRHCLTHGIDTIFLSIHGKYRGKLVSTPGKNIRLRVAQVNRMQDAHYCLELARELVIAKIVNTRKLVRKRHARYPSPDARAASRKLGRWIQAATLAETLETIRGIEGAAAAAYFSVLGTFIRRSTFTFRKRTRRPPRDRVNALLSFYYTMVANRSADILTQVGLDPCLGTLHAMAYGRPSLALDLMEPFRPLVDAMVLEAINRRIIRPEHFIVRPDLLPENPDDEYEHIEEEDYPVLLTPSGLKAAIYYFETIWHRTKRDPDSGENSSLNRLMEQQAARMVRSVLENRLPMGAYLDEAAFRFD